MYAVTAAEFTAEGKANILINRCGPLRGCARSIVSDNGLQVWRKYFACLLQAYAGSKRCHQRLPPKRKIVLWRV